MAKSFDLIGVTFFSLSLFGCGVYTPDKNPLVSNEPRPGVGASDQGDFENRLVFHIQCEIEAGLEETRQLKLPWLSTWGTTVTHSITVEDQGGVSPGVSTIQPIASAAVPFVQYASQSIGAAASANALRTETIQYTFKNRDIEKYTVLKRCADYRGKPFIEGDLKIREFIFDHAELVATGNASLSSKEGHAVFNTFTDEITFVASYGGSVTPTWKLARLTANTATNLLVAQRTNTDDLVITIGPIKTDKSGKPVEPLQLIDTAMGQHQTRVQANAIAVAVQGQAH